MTTWFLVILWSYTANGISMTTLPVGYISKQDCLNSVSQIAAVDYASNPLPKFLSQALFYLCVPHNNQTN